MPINHSILMVTYNQERFIAQALGSILKQQVLPLEIIISDDGSTDKTREIISHYILNYPGIIRTLFHENLGIYANLNFLVTHADVRGDMVSFLAGDDYFKDGMISAFNDLIEQKHLSPRKEKFIVLSNQLILLPEGEEKEKINNYSLQGKDYIKLKLRNKIGSRYSGISRALYDEMGLWRTDLGLWADYLHSLDLYAKCAKFYFINKYFPVYRIGSGVTSTEKRELFLCSYVKVLSFVLHNRASLLDWRDRIFVKKQLYKSEYGLNASILGKIKYFYYYLVGFIDVLTGYEDFLQYFYEGGTFLPKKIRKLLKKTLKIKGG